jgi:5-methyltetrahydrofolate--homocysteine methyltransferase
MTADERMPIVEKIVRRVEKEGISLENLLIDPLAMPVGAEPEAVKQTLETIYRVREKYGLNMSIGASNISFGLPNRHALNAAFMPMAMSMGLTSAIMDGRTPEVVQAVRGADLLLALDAWGANWITKFRESK